MGKYKEIDIDYLNYSEGEKDNLVPYEIYPYFHSWKNKEKNLVYLKIKKEKDH